MDTRTTQTRVVAGSLFDLAEWLWLGAMGVKLAASVIGFMVLAMGLNAVTGALVTAVLTVIGGGMRWLANTWRAKADAVQRTVDLADGLGWPISGVFRSDLLAQIPNWILTKAKSSTPDPYFASALPGSPNRAAENLGESTWFSKNLARSLGAWVVVTVLISFAGAFIALYLVATAGVAVDTAQVAAQTILLLLMLVWDLELAQLAVGYFGFAADAEKSELAAQHMLDSGAVALGDIVREWSQYHVARSSAPPIPYLWWKLKQKRLNEIWKSERAKTTSGVAAGR